MRVNAIESTDNNDQLTRLIVGGIQFGAATFEGKSAGSNLGGNDLVFYNCYFGGLISMKNINCAGFQDCKIDGNALFENAIYPYISGGAGQNPNSTLTFIYDDTPGKKIPSYGPSYGGVYATIERTLIPAPVIQRVNTGFVNVRMRIGARAGILAHVDRRQRRHTYSLHGAVVLGTVVRTGSGTILNTGSFYNNAASGLAASDMQAAVTSSTTRSALRPATPFRKLMFSGGDVSGSTMTCNSKPAWSALLNSPRMPWTLTRSRTGAVTEDKLAEDYLMTDGSKAMAGESGYGQ